MDTASDCHPSEMEFKLDEIIQTNHKRLLNFVLRRVRNQAEAEDLVQAAYLEAIRGSGQFQGLSRPETWLFGIAINLIRNHFSRAPISRYVFESDEMLEFETTDEPSPEEAMILKRRMHALDKCIDSMPEDMRITLILVTVEDLSYHEVAETLGVPVGTVRSRLSRAREVLKKEMATID